MTFRGNVVFGPKVCCSPLLSGATTRFFENLAEKSCNKKRNGEGFDTKNLSTGAKTRILKHRLAEQLSTKPSRPAESSPNRSWWNCLRNQARRPNAGFRRKKKKAEAFTFRLKFHHYHPGFWAKTSGNIFGTSICLPAKGEQKGPWGWTRHKLSAPSRWILGAPWSPTLRHICWFDG